METRNKIRTFQDLIVYQNLYQAMLIVMREIIPHLPREEKYDLVDQIRRCCKAPLALLAEGFAKRYQRLNWKKYLDECLGECYEMINHLTICKDLYSSYLDKSKLNKVIDLYIISSKQLYKLRESWQDFHKND